ncbi:MULTISPECIES: peptide-methionine (S)-S-oxide reductase MsrA [Maribacter]|uniref:Peptide methionine sulfoxide reductase MsrA n=1 Tax=Maribacter dokdonensis TaxID=320912 RepID=A0A1H4PKB4_9FLAO|nr:MULTISPECIES: peptide-methionine (S)-S-oxide reductase MsrA [Maribacter]KSA14559.1 Peptide methionine sulfoxide reductase MsrA [Maribacter dokdonensis DSW-8]SEC07674.1 peptide-methionine (S)-S-oxide reductase [Maribacter dokdonensis]HAF76612.1 peptide-methionine (S)-S-oxide reductase [Maribacter sp.]|tara:strand:+ start:17245 stop:17952 length:708 start_codon:yes stop_codon:yes gene_type:complete
MKLLQIVLLAGASLIATSCQSKNKKNTISENTPAKETQQEEMYEEVKLSPQQLSKYETAYFASGCFWCVEAIFESVKGVKEVVSGYAGGEQKNPTYEEVGYGKTDHAEAVEVYYDPKVISFTQLVQVFFGSHDPTQLNRQGPDRGRQYRSIAFYKNEDEKKIIESYIQALVDNKVYDNDPITTEVTPYTVFYKAESYHQDYEKNNPNNSYIRNVSIPRLNRFKANFGDYLKENTH